MSIADLPPAAPESPPVADDFSGTNSEKIDKPVAAVTDLRANVRIFYWASGVALPALFGLMAYVVLTLGALNTKVEATGVRVGLLEARFDRLEARVDKLEARLTEVTDRLARIEERVGRLEERLNAIERQQRETNDLLRQLLARPAGK